MKKIVNILVISIWVFAQMMTAVHSQVHLPGHLMPASNVHSAMQHQVTHQHQNSDAKSICGMHAQQDEKKSADDSQGDNGTENCCKDFHSQSADVIKSQPSNFHVTGIVIYQKLLTRHDGRLPSFAPPPPNTRT